MNDRERETRLYLIGYGLALSLTVAAFAAVRWPSVGSRASLGVVFGLALAQVLVQFRCFLNIDLKRSSRADLLLVTFASVIIALMVSGTLVILLNLRDRMM